MAGGIQPLVADACHGVTSVDERCRVQGREIIGGRVLEVAVVAQFQLHAFLLVELAREGVVHCLRHHYLHAGLRAGGCFCG